MKVLLRIARAIDTVSESVAGVVRWALLLNALLMAANVFARKIFAYSIVEIFDLQWHFFAAVVLLMAAYTLKNDEHVRVDIFAQRLGERGLAWLDLFGIVLILVPLCALMVWATTPPFIASLAPKATRESVDGISHIPVWIIKSFIPIGFLLLTLQGVAEAIRCVACLNCVIRRPVHRRQLIDQVDLGG